MSIFSRLWAIFGNKPKKAAKTTYGIPAVKFDSSQVSKAVKADIRKNVELLEGVDPKHFDRIYDVAVLSVMAGRDLSLLFNALIEMNISGMTTSRAGQIARILNNKASAVISIEQQQSLGITHSIWLYSGASCDQHDSSHAAANGKQYDVRKGMFLDGKWTWPGYEEGCRCASKPIIKGFKY